MSNVDPQGLEQQFPKDSNTTLNDFIIEYTHNFKHAMDNEAKRFLGEFIVYGDKFYIVSYQDCQIGKQTMKQFTTVLSQKDKSNNSMAENGFGGTECLFRFNSDCMILTELTKSKYLLQKEMNAAKVRTLCEELKEMCMNDEFNETDKEEKKTEMRQELKSGEGERRGQDDIPAHKVFNRVYRKLFDPYNEWKSAIIYSFPLTEIYARESNWYNFKLNQNESSVSSLKSLCESDNENKKEFNKSYCDFQRRIFTGEESPPEITTCFLEENSKSDELTVIDKYTSTCKTDYVEGEIQLYTTEDPSYEGAVGHAHTNSMTPKIIIKFRDTNGIHYMQGFFTNKESRQIGREFKTKTAYKDKNKYSVDNWKELLTNQNVAFNKDELKNEIATIHMEETTEAYSSYKISIGGMWVKPDYTQFKNRTETKNSKHFKIQIHIKNKKLFFPKNDKNAYLKNHIQKTSIKSLLHLTEDGKAPWLADLSKYFIRLKNCPPEKIKYNNTKYSKNITGNTPLTHRQPVKIYSRNPQYVYSTSTLLPIPSIDGGTFYVIKIGESVKPEDRRSKFTAGLKTMLKQSSLFENDIVSQLKVSSADWTQMFAYNIQPVINDSDNPKVKAEAWEGKIKTKLSDSKDLFISVTNDEGILREFFLVKDTNYSKATQYLYRSHNEVMEDIKDKR